MEQKTSSVSLLSNRLSSGSQLSTQVHSDHPTRPRKQASSGTTLVQDPTQRGLIRSVASSLILRELTMFSKASSPSRVSEIRQSFIPDRTVALSNIINHSRSARPSEKVSKSLRERLPILDQASMNPLTLPTSRRLCQPVRPVNHKVTLAGIPVSSHRQSEGKMKSTSKPLNSSKGSSSRIKSTILWLREFVSSPSGTSWSKVCHRSPTKINKCLKVMITT